MKNKPIWPPPKPNFWGDREACNAWYAEHIESLGPAVEVTGYLNDDGSPSEFDSNPTSHATHTALLIGITPIREETADDLLEQLVSTIENAGIIEFKGMRAPNMPSLAKVKEYLARKKAGGK